MHPPRARGGRYGTLSTTSSPRATSCRDLYALHDDDPSLLADSTLVTPLSEFGRRVEYRITDYSPLLDSSNMSGKEWARIAQDIADGYRLRVISMAIGTLD